MTAALTAKTEETVGAVLVVGGGIAGIQASLDLADSGQKVFLLEESPAIGGTMARLDKTFPTNDCSMCILSPKVVECGRHPDIETITWSELEEVSGSAGNFTVRIRRRARFVDLAKCTGCGDCEEVCPVTVPNEFDAGIGYRKSIFRPCPQAYPNTFVIDKSGVSPCRTGCPAGINVNAYVALAAEGRFDEALDVVLRTVPLPGVLGRVCHHPCEQKCHMKNYGESVSICAIKRFLADRKRQREPDCGEPRETRRTQDLEKVAIIGSGPAGLAAAGQLAEKGYRPVIFEGQSRAGGMLAWGIPDYRLPPEVLDAEIREVLDKGVELKLNCRFGVDVSHEDLRKQGFAATLLAIGAHRGSSLGVRGEDLDGVTDSIEFLRLVNSGTEFTVGSRVTVVGGGNSAIDAARSALRLGAEKVTVVYRRSRFEMPAISAEVDAAEHEGVQFVFLANPTALSGRDGRVVSMQCVRMRLGEPDESGRCRPVPIADSGFTVETDMVIPAIGQKVVLPDDPMIEQLEQTRWGTFSAGDRDGITNIEGVFAAGDAVTGPRSVIEAIAEGKKVASAMDAYLRGKTFRPEPEIQPEQVVDVPEMPRTQAHSRPRQHASELSIAERVDSFDEVEATLTEEQVIAESRRCLHCAGCSECMACVAACKAEAISHGQEDEIEELNVGAVIAVPGFEEFIAGLNYDYGYSRYPDVVSSIEFERILSASGPSAGHVRRPSDDEEPRKIAFLQCVGSRDLSCRNAYCSSVCCMYAIKEAVIAKEHLDEVEITIFFMDVRAFGKDFERYYQRAESESGVEFVRARVSDVFSRNGTGSLSVRYSPESGGVSERNFDMIVLSVGLEPGRGFSKLAERLGVARNQFGFIASDSEIPVRTTRPGIFVAGAASGPKDIPETVIESGAAACEAGSLLSEARRTMTRVPEDLPETDVGSQPPRIGVFVCHCGINIGSVVDVPGTAEFARQLPHVQYAEENLYTCSQDTQEHIQEMIREHGLNRVVVASCSPRTHEPLFQQTLREAGLNPYLFTMANIRDQCSWTHRESPEAATEKAAVLLSAAVAKAALLRPLHTTEVPVKHRALVVGGGLAGMAAALAIADHGYEVSLLEQRDHLGGNLRELYVGFDGQDLPEMLAAVTGRIDAHPLVSVRTGTAVKDVEGFVGNFVSTLTDGEEIRHGVAVLATGAQQYEPKEFLYGQDDRVITQKQLAAELGQHRPEWSPPRGRVVMIQCVGSRNDDHPYCSRVCCTRAVQNAIRLKELSPETEVVVFYRDIRTYGFRELSFARAREMGVVFTRFEQGMEPTVQRSNGELRVRALDPILGAELDLAAEMVVLSAGIQADYPAVDSLAKLFKVPLNSDGFLLEAHVKLRPVEFATDGVFVAGLAHGPKSIDESTVQALAAASKACTILDKSVIETQAAVAEVLPDRCVACGLCEKICVFGAVSLEEVEKDKEKVTVASVNPALCKGCGACVAGCRSSAVKLHGFTDQQILAEIGQI